MASGIIGNDVPRKGLRVRVPCPPLSAYSKSLPFPTGLLLSSDYFFCRSRFQRDFFFPQERYPAEPVKRWR